MGEDVTLSMIEGHENFNMVDVRCKVFLVKEPAAIRVNEGRMKQDIIPLVSDHNGSLTSHLVGRALRI